MNDMPSNWKNISVFLDDTPESGKVGECAATLAQRFGAHLIGIHSITGTPGEYASDCFARGKKAIDSILTRRQDAEKEQALAVGHDILREPVRRRGPSDDDGAGADARILRSKHLSHDLVQRRSDRMRYWSALDGLSERGRALEMRQITAADTARDQADKDLARRERFRVGRRSVHLGEYLWPD